MTRSQQEQQQQQRMEAETSVAEGGTMSTKGCNDGSMDENRTSLYAAPSSSPTPSPPAPPPPPPPRSTSVSPQTRSGRGSHQQQLQRFSPAVIAESGSWSPWRLAGGDSEEGRPSLKFAPNWPHATDRCNGSSQTEPEREQKAQSQHQQSPHSTPGNRLECVPVVVCTDGIRLRVVSRVRPAIYGENRSRGARKDLCRAVLRAVTCVLVLSVFSSILEFCIVLFLVSFVVASSTSCLLVFPSPFLPHEFLFHRRHPSLFTTKCLGFTRVTKKHAAKPHMLMPALWTALSRPHR